MLQIVYVFLNTNLGLLALYIADRYFGVLVRDLVFVHASGCFFEEVLSGTIKHRGLPVHPSFLSCNSEGSWIRGVIWTSEHNDSVEAEGKKIVDPLVWVWLASSVVRWRDRRTKHHLFAINIATSNISVVVDASLSSLNSAPLEILKQNREAGP